MNNTPIITTEKTVLQVFHNYYAYTKDQKSFSDRKRFTAWKTAVISKSGYLRDNKLMISDKDPVPDFDKYNLVILNDYNTDNENEALKLQHKRWNKELIEIESGPDGRMMHKLNHVKYLNMGGSKKKFLIFSFKVVRDVIELHLEYDYYEIGQPKRDNFKLCDLTYNVPVEIKINGKLDHSLSSGRERTFKENSYIVELIGTTRTIALAPSPLAIQKPIPKPHKTINLMKTLY